jgi:glycosyltransferase involved in cell wall biosynthesis
MSGLEAAGFERDGRRVAIFRQNLFRVSETFITEQAGAMRRYRPFYLGRLRFGDAPAGAESLALGDLGGALKWPRIVRQMLTRETGPYVRALGGRRPALVHAHFGIDGVYALPLARRLGVPLVTTFHGYDATLSTVALLSSPAWANYPLFRQQLARQGELFLCVSSFIRERVLAMGFPAARTVLHHVGVDCDAIRPRDAAEEGAFVLFVGRLVEMKGAEVLLDAFARLAPRHAGVTLVMIGDGELRRSLEARAGSLGLGERVRFLGARPRAEVLAWMRRAMMLVLPSVQTGSGRREGLGMVSLEAAATGVAVIGSRTGGLPESLVDGETGFLTAERDVEGLAKRIGALLDDAGLRGRLGAAGRARVERDFDLGRQTGLLEGMYDAVLAARG